MRRHRQSLTTIIAINNYPTSDGNLILFQGGITDRLRRRRVQLNFRSSGMLHYDVIRIIAHSHPSIVQFFHPDRFQFASFNLSIQIPSIHPSVRPSIAATRPLIITTQELKPLQDPCSHRAWREHYNTGGSRTRRLHQNGTRWSASPQVHEYCTINMISYHITS